MNKLYGYKVTFKVPPIEGESKTEFYFTSLAAIFEVFTDKEIGCKCSRLWNLKITEKRPYNGRRCSVERINLRRKSRIKPCAGR